MMKPRVVPPPPRCARKGQVIRPPSRGFAYTMSSWTASLGKNVAPSPRPRPTCNPRLLKLAKPEPCCHEAHCCEEYQEEFEEILVEDEHMEERLGVHKFKDEFMEEKNNRHENTAEIVRITNKVLQDRLGVHEFECMEEKNARHENTAEIVRITNKVLQDRLGVHEFEDEFMEEKNARHENTAEIVRITNKVLQDRLGVQEFECMEEKNARHENTAEIVRITNKVLQDRLGVQGFEHGEHRRRNQRRSVTDADSTRVDLNELRYSQLSCRDTFYCGRSVEQLVQDLLNQKVKLSAPFLRLTVFETTDERTHETVLRCVDNRRLYALKEYSRRSVKNRLMVNVNLYTKETLWQLQRFTDNSGNTVMVNSNLFSNETLTEYQRFLDNSDNTPGFDVRLRKTNKGKGSGKKRRRSCRNKKSSNRKNQIPSSRYLKDS